MLCYKDRTFCASDCTDRDCYRHANPDDMKKAEALNLPVAWADFSATCTGYRPPTEE